MIIDIHIHMAGTGSESGCYMSDYLKMTPAYLIMLITTNMIFKKVNDKTIRQHHLKILEDSKLDRGVFLAMDEAYNSKGEKMTTHLYTPNDYVAEIAKKEKKVLFGASVHPDRKDAINEMEKVVENGAALMKWIPSSQNINPEKKKYNSFYKKLADLEIPLLCHVGAEHTIPEPNPLLKSRYHKLNNPANIIQALECGVKVIAAHCCTPVFFLDTVLFKDYFKNFLSLMKKSIK
ncbi:amidohydrolase family protein, partial [Candidatus Sumerlaeota bacterium]|nr:amidohydrolase family protein [Candidatus Sumerlaeota bacterium]